MNQKKNTPSRLQTFLVIGCCLLCIVGIVFLKRASDTRSPAYAKALSKAMQAEEKADSVRNMAVPDTVGDASVLPIVTETLPPALPDSVGKDMRPASNAGHEDGYLAGMYDGKQGAHLAGFDDTNTFPTEAEQKAYADAYHEGYEHGYAEGKAHAAAPTEVESSHNGSAN